MHRNTTTLINHLRHSAFSIVAVLLVPFVSAASNDNQGSADQSNTNAHPSFVLSSHHLEQVEGGSVYRPNGNDPYFVIQIQASWFNQTQNSLHLPIRISANEDFFASDKKKQPSLELFTEVDAVSETQFSVDPNYFSRFPLSVERLDKVLSISLPGSLELQGDQIVRVDLNACRSCEIAITHTASDLTGSESPLKANLFFNGLLALEQDKLLQLNLDEWQLHNMEFGDAENILRGQSHDPYIRLDNINVELHTVAGFYLEFDALRQTKHSNSSTQADGNSVDRKYQEFQLYHADHLHSISRTVVTQFKLETHANEAKTDTAGNASHCGNKVFVPFDHLKAETTSHDAHPLRGLRLDFPDSGDITEWAVCQIALVPNGLKANYQQLDNAIFAHRSFSRLTAKQLVMGIFQNLRKDWAFMLLLLASSFFFLYRAIIAFRRR